MRIRERCEKIPVTISIQLSAEEIKALEKELSQKGIQIRIGTHISLKYIDYEADISSDRKQNIISQLKSYFSINPLTHIDFTLCDDYVDSSFPSQFLLGISPRTYLQELHCQIINCLGENAVIFREADLDNFFPHITCRCTGELVQMEAITRELKELRVTFHSWKIAFHSSEGELYLE